MFFSFLIQRKRTLFLKIHFLTVLRNPAFKQVAQQKEKKRRVDEKK